MTRKADDTYPSIPSFTLESFKRDGTILGGSNPSRVTIQASQHNANIPKELDEKRRSFQTIIDGFLQEGFIQSEEITKEASGKMMIPYGGARGMLLNPSVALKLVIHCQVTTRVVILRCEKRNFALSLTENEKNVLEDIGDSGSHQIYEDEDFWMKFYAQHKSNFMSIPRFKIKIKNESLAFLSHA
jgi:hypothetical protein